MPQEPDGAVDEGDSEGGEAAAGDEGEEEVREAGEVVVIRCAVVD